MAFHDGFSPFILPVEYEEGKIKISKNKFAELLMREKVGVSGNYYYVVQEWDWVKNYLADNFFTSNAVDYKNKCMIFYLNEKYKKIMLII